MKPKVAIMNISDDEVSLALKEEWEGRGYSVLCYNVLSFLSNNDHKRLHNVSLTFFKADSKLRDVVYTLTNNRVAVFFIRMYLKRKFISLFNQCQKDNPQVLIAVHPLTTQLGALYKKYFHKSTYLFSIVTDYTVHQMSISKLNEKLFAPISGSLRRLERVPIKQLGTPLTKKYDDIKTKSARRKELKINRITEMVVVSTNVNKMSEQQIIESVKGKKRPLHLFWFKDFNEKPLCEKTYYQNGSTITYVTSLQDYYKYLQAADLAITKPSGVKLAEATYYQLPIVCVQPQSIQEHQNVIELMKQKDHMYLFDRHTNLSVMIDLWKDHQPIDKRKRSSELVVDEMFKIIERNIKREKQLCSTPIMEKTLNKNV
ncbi:hypothetical protein LGQ02_13725 [Bacillus shivajii]|uniref:MGDG synthase family glycosyltransferase n=1 Tax=Bacillus shivajii TaxID=1983719 RepID=UPI001CFBD14E|nr:hypothetical protein [Bacillus shivajii]UCZ51911.1 hypothetical protein LGQ02_13725 [Bacillus shivajii]